MLSLWSPHATLQDIVSSEEDFIHTSSALVFMPGPIVAVAAARGFSLAYLDVVISGACVSGPMAVLQLGRQYLASYYPQGKAQTADKNTHTIFQ